MDFPIHSEIMEKLQYFNKIHKIPNIIFHGPSGNGKRTIVNKFINMIYNNDKDKIKSFVMHVNCAHGKGIKFIREDLKFFSKTHIHSNGGDVFKSIVMVNTDKLTIDAQSALRRCIELFSSNTRFFIIVEDKYKLLKPILSRFCEIYIPEPIINGVPTNLYKHIIRETFKLKDVKTQRTTWLKKELQKTFLDNNNNNKNEKTLIEIAVKLYEKSYSGVDIISLIETNNFINLSDEKRYELLFSFNKIKREFRNEKLLIIFILNFLFLDNEFSLENISFI